MSSDSMIYQTQPIANFLSDRQSAVACAQTSGSVHMHLELAGYSKAGGPCMHLKDIDDIYHRDGRWFSAIATDGRLRSQQHFSLDPKLIFPELKYSNYTLTGSRGA